MIKDDDTFQENGWFVTALRTVFDVSFFLYGLYREMGCAIISGYLLVILIIKSREGLRIRINVALVSVITIALFYFISVFWAVDPWLALRGVVKFLAVPLFTLCLMQGDHESRMRILHDIPYIGAIMTTAAYILGLLPVFAVTIWWRGRFAGFFTYPNVYACFLLLGLELLFTMENDKKHKFRDVTCGAILFFGMLQSGSRIVFILAVPGIIAALLIRRNICTVQAGACSLAGGYVINHIVSLIIGHDSSGRVLQISTNSSSLRSRLLYWKDALPVALTHPFGFGYRGYSYIQGSVETGPYNVMVVHNSFLQIMLDVGWIPAILAFIAVIRGFFSKHATAASRLVLATLIIHSVVDFDLEFISMYFILMCLLDLDAGKEFTLQIPLLVEIVPTALVYAFCLYVGIACMYMHNGDYRTAFRLCPWDTTSETRVMERTGDIAEKRRLAEDILSRNKYVASAWNTLAMAAYDDVDLGSYIEYQRKAISLSRYNIDYYYDYFSGMKTFYEMYSKEGDTEAMDICLSEISSIGTMLEELKAGTDSLAWSEDIESDFTMPEKYYEFLDEHGL